MGDKRLSRILVTSLGVSAALTLGFNTLAGGLDTAELLATSFGAYAITNVHLRTAFPKDDKVKIKPLVVMSAFMAGVSSGYFGFDFLSERAIALLQGNEITQSVGSFLQENQFQRMTNGVVNGFAFLSALFAPMVLFYTGKGVYDTVNGTRKGVTGDKRLFGIAALSLMVSTVTVGIFNVLSEGSMSLVENAIAAVGAYAISTTHLRGAFPENGKKKLMDLGIMAVFMAGAGSAYYGYDGIVNGLIDALKDSNQAEGVLNALSDPTAKRMAGSIINGFTALSVVFGAPLAVFHTVKGLWQSVDTPLKALSRSPS